ncbi:MAG TPA: thymidylate kinase [Candidatus Paceibacterota bacterium]
MKGKLIVIDGTDGSGKATHAGLLIDRLSREGKEVKLTDFPQYGQPSAFFVEKYLRGEYGPLESVDAYKASLFYALDRYDASFHMRRWLEEGTIIVSNRYVSSNMGHQAGKIADPREREKFLTWLKDIEYGMLDIPHPDVNILLFMPPEVGQRLVDNKGDRAYTKGKKRDIHEGDINHLRHASEAYREVAQREGWKIISCVQEDGATLRAIEEIHEELYAYLKECNAV